MKAKNVYTGILCMLTVVMFMIVMSGCSHRIKDEHELKADLMKNSNFSMVEGSEISEFTIVKRLTEKEKREDKVWVSLEIDHESATETRSYVMYYKDYNEGWLLDSFLSFNDIDHEWKVTPKQMPSNEAVMEALLEYSRQRIDEKTVVINGVERVDEETFYKYWFEEGKYVTRINPGEVLNDTDYQCFTVTDQVFPRGESYEKTRTLRSLNFLFNANTYQWELTGVENLVFDSTISDAPVVFETTGVIDMYENEEIKSYIDKVEEYLTYFYEERNIKGLKEMLHPLCDELYLYIESALGAYKNYEYSKKTILCVIPGEVKFFESDDEEIESYYQELKKRGIDTEEIVECYCDFAISDDEEVYFDSFQGLFIKVKDKIYLLDAGGLY